MTPFVLALALAGQYPSPQAPQYGAPPPQFSAPVTYATSVPQVTLLGAGQVLQPNPFGAMLGRLGQRLEKHAWPRVQPVTVAAPPPVQQTIYLQMTQPVVQQAVYTVAQPAFAPAVQYQAPPSYGSPQPPPKAPPAQTYGSPQAPSPQYGAQAPQFGAQQPQAQAENAKHDESVPPVPKR
jgi:hypothetical protein